MNGRIRGYMSIRTNRLLRTLLAVVLGLVIVFEAGTVNKDMVYVKADKIKDLKDQNKKDQQKVDEINEQIDDLTGEKEGIEDEIATLGNQIAELIASISLLEEEIAQKQEEIVQAQKDLEAAIKVENDQYSIMKERIHSMYEAGDVNYIDIFISAKSMEDLLNRADYIEQIHSYDQKVLLDYKAARQRVEELKEELEIEESELEACQDGLKEEQEGVEAARAELEQISADYAVQISKAKQQAEVYKTKIKKQNAEIKKLEEEARKKAEEEARRKKAAEEAAKKKANNGNSNSSSQTTSKPKGTATVNTSEINACNGSAKGKEIAIYACGFVGCPYVAGGTSLTNGTDCSGFTQGVYKAHGYSIPRNSFSQRSAGKEVAYADAQPGDIICYAGHVALYIGNGKIVHASSAKTGIKISYATYKPIITVRRIV